MTMLWLQADDDTGADRFAGDTPVDSEGSQRDTREDVFKREHDALINSEAVQAEQASREKLRRFVESEVERIRPRQEQYEAQQAAREAQRAASRQKSKDRAAEARAAAEARRAQREAERQEREEGVSAKRGDALKSKEGGQLKSYAKKSRAVYFIQQVRTDVERRYDEMDDEVHEQEQRIKEIDKELRSLTNEKRDALHEFGQESRTLRRTSEEDERQITREVGKMRQELFKQNAQNKIAANRLRTERSRLQATINTKRTELKRFKRLVEQVRRVYENRNSTLGDPLKELEQLHAELRRFKIYLPNLRLAA